jgi:uncharacterized protein YjbI with pentapeptide repeats/beta-lactamase regulating signal transducer with metallopeptidase domain
MNEHWLNGISEVWATETWTIFWQGSALILVALAAAALLRRRSAHLRYAILMLPLIKLMLPPIPIPVSGSATTAALVPPIYSSSENRSETTIASSGAASTAAMAKQAAWNWQALLFLIYGGGVLAGGFLLLCRYRRLRKLISNGRKVGDDRVARIYEEVLAAMGWKREAELLECSCPGPMAAGLARKRILLPAGVKFSSAEWRVILAHEAAHVKRRDVAVEFAQSLVQLVWWFNPLVWMLNRQIRRTREECCDEVLLARKAVEAEDYCDTLIKTARKLACARPAFPTAGIAGHPIAKRMERIMNPGLRVASGLTKAQAALIMGLALFVLPNIKAIAERTNRADEPSAFFALELLPSTYQEPEVVMNGQILDGVNWEKRALRGAALCHASLRNANLRGADLRSANLTGANLRDADLSGADLSGANLTGADLTGAILTGASLSRGLLSGARFDGANLDNANLDWAFLRGTLVSETTRIASKWRTVIELSSGRSGNLDLAGVDLSRANLSKLGFVNGRLNGADLSGADLSFADLRGTMLDGASMKGANLEGCQLDRASLEGANLERANLSRTQMHGSNLGSANLARANLSSAKLHDANVSSADFGMADLRWARLERIRTNSVTKLEGKWRLAKELQEKGAAGMVLAGSDLTEMDLHDVSFSGMNLGGANLRGAILTGGDFSGASLVGTKLEGARLGIATDRATRLAPKWALANELVLQGAANRDLTGIDLSHANLSGARLEGAVLRDANLDGAILDGTNLRSANLMGTSLKQARFHNTVMPDGSIRSDGC